MNIIKPTITIFLITFSSLIFAQNSNYIEYYRNVEKAISKGVFSENNDSTIYYLNIAFNKAEPYPEDLLIISKALYNNGNKDKAYKFLIKSLEKGIDTASIRKIEILPFLNKTEISQLEAKYINYKIECDTILFHQLDSVIKLDQSVRQFDWSDTTSITFKSSLKKMNIQDSLNRVWILNTIKEKGWMGRKLIGNDRISFILLLHIHKEWFEKHSDILKKEIIKGNLNPSYLAGTLDRANFGTGNFKYASFLPGNMPIKEDTEEMKNNRFKIGALSTRVFFYRGQFRFQECKIHN